MSQTTILEISAEQQGWMLRELRRCRYGHVLALHILLLLVRGKSPSEIADFLLCSRSSVYRTRDAWQQGHLSEQWWPLAAVLQREPTLNRFQRTLHWLIQQPPHLFGWCRTRWSCTALALTITARTGVSWSRETVRRQLRAQGYVWKRAKLKAKDDDPERASKLARIRAIIEQLRPSQAFFWGDELDLHLLPKVGSQWVLKGTQLEVPTPGQNQKQYLAGALDYRTGKMRYVIGPRKTNALFRQLLALLEAACGPHIKHIYVVVDNYRIHKTPEVVRWLEQHPRLELLWLPRYCPQANPIERAFGDVHDKCTRNHLRQRLHWLIWDVKQHLARNGPWQYQLPSLYYESDVEVELANIYLNRTRKLAA